MKKRHKIRNALGRILACFLLIGFFSAVILSSAFLLYATKGIDAELDMEMLVSNQGRTTKL